MHRCVIASAWCDSVCFDLAASAEPVHQMAPIAVETGLFSPPRDNQDGTSSRLVPIDDGSDAHRSLLISNDSPRNPTASPPLEPEAAPTTQRQYAKASPSATV